MDLVVATFNPGKLREIESLLGRPDLRLRSLDTFAGATPPDEVGATLLENAALKARAAWTLARLPAIADDTGLEVDALGGRPGVRSARYAGPEANAEENVRRLLSELEGVPPERRAARFRTVCVAVLGAGVEIAVEGTLEGRITTVARGTGGFGYDPVFEVPAFGRTLAELTSEEKNAISHRGMAIRALAERLAAL